MDQLRLQVDLSPSVCYVDEDRYVENGDVIMRTAVKCALTDYLDCQNNIVDSCKLIDCFYDELKDPNSQFLSEDPNPRSYLFSACVPRTFQPLDNVNVCSVVA